VEAAEASLTIDILSCASILIINSSIMGLILDAIIRLSFQLIFLYARPS